MMLSFTPAPPSLGALPSAAARPSVATSGSREALLLAALSLKPRYAMKYLTVAPQSNSKPITIQVLDAAPDVPGTAKSGTHPASGLGVAAAARAATDKGIP